MTSAERNTQSLARRASAVWAKVPWRIAWLSLGAIIALRAALFGNDFVWTVYAAKLKPSDIGWRQVSVVRGRAVAYQTQQPSASILAVGSSQTDALYEVFAARHPELDTYSVSALSPVDLVLYQDEIFARRPQTILLYLGEFDLARMPDPAALAIAPRQGSRLFEITRNVNGAPSPADYRQSMIDLAIGELLPEYKYRFVLRGVADKAILKVSRRLGKSPSPQPRATLEQRIEWLRESFNSDAIPFNIQFLQQFLAAAERKDISVIVIEGSMNPLVDAVESSSRQASVRAALTSTVGAYEHVRFIRREEITTFTELDYSDLTHVKPEAGDRFVVALMELLGHHPVTVTPSKRADAMALERMDELERKIEAQPDARVVFLGDSLTQAWEAEGVDAWKRYFGDLHAINLGVTGDRTENLLWRLSKLERASLDPTAVVIQIGTNNSMWPDQTAAEIAAGIRSVTQQVRKCWPNAAVLLVGMLPRATPNDEIGLTNNRINDQLERSVSSWGIRYLDVTPALSDASGALRDEFRRDRVHLSSLGYEQFATALSPPLRALLDQH